MENVSLKEQVRANMQLKETDALIEIWQRGDLTEWTPEALDIVQEILLSRLGEVPARLPQEHDPPHSIQLKTDRESKRNLLDLIIKMQCPHCGKNINETDRFCPHCGEDLEAPIEPAELKALAQQYLKEAQKTLDNGGNLKNALASCDQSIEFIPESAEAHNLRGLILDVMGETSEAILEYKEALRLAPDFTEAKENLEDAKHDLQVPRQDERVMAALAHISALLPFIGIIVPMIIWVTQKEKSKYAAFQSLQALVYQLTMIIAWLFGMGFCMVSSFGLYLAESSASSFEEIAKAMVLADFIPLVILGVVFIGGTLGIVYAVFGAIDTIRGQPFRYVLIGKRLENSMQPKKSAD